jgi:hypothetical protein
MTEGIEGRGQGGEEGMRWSEREDANQGALSFPATPYVVHMPPSPLLPHTSTPPPAPPLTWREDDLDIELLVGLQRPLRRNDLEVAPVLRLGGLNRLLDQPVHGHLKGGKGKGEDGTEKSADG